MPILQKLFEWKSRSVFYIHLAIILLTIHPALGQDVLFSNTISGTNPNTENPYSSGQITNENITSTGIGRGNGISGRNTNNRYNANGWDSETFDPEDYFTFTLVPNETYKINFSSFVFTGEASGTGPISFSFRSSIDDFSTDIGSPTATGATINLSSSMFQNVCIPIEFRLYAWGASDTRGTFSVNDFSFTGTVISMGCTIPEGAGIIIGPIMVIPYQEGVEYSIPEIGGATGYEWSIPSGATITAGNNTPNITISFGTESGSIRVRGTNACEAGKGPLSEIHSVTVGYPEIYFHNFGTTEISAHPYTDPPSQLDEKISYSEWTNSNGKWLSFAGVSGEAISMKGLTGSPVITLSLEIEEGFQLSVTSFNFWTQRSSTGSSNWKMTINGIEIGSGTVPETGSYVGKTNVDFDVLHLTGTVFVRLLLSEASGTGTFRLDDFTLYGQITPVALMANAGPDQKGPETCGMTKVTIEGNLPSGCSGTWSIEEGNDGVIENANEARTTFEGRNNEDYTLRWTLNRAGEEAWDEMQVELNQQPTVQITNPLPVCPNSTVDLTHAGITQGSSEGILLSYWTDELAEVPLVEPSAVTNAGTYFIKGETLAGCFAIKPVTVSFHTLDIEIEPLAGNPLCPQLDPDQGFNANSSSYSPGVTKLNYLVRRENSAYAWSFNYSLSGGTVDATYEPYLPSTGIISLSESSEEFEVVLFVENKPGVEQAVQFSVTTVKDTDHGCNFDLSGHNTTTVISAMPVVGKFE